MTSRACCQRPPLTVDYTTQGRYETLAGLQTYIVGPDDASQAIIDVYDIFGAWPQTLQGADLLSSLTGALVLVPDFFRGGGAKPEWLPPDTDEKLRLITTFVETIADFQGNLPVLLQVRKALAERYPAVDDHVGIFGLCWGGKMAVMATGADNVGPGRRFTASGTPYPGRLDVKDAKALTAPHILLAFKEEPANVVAAYKTILAQPSKAGKVETYNTIHYGWIGARADLESADNVKEFTRKYKQAVAFFNKHL